MANWDALGKELERRGKTGALRDLMDSAEGRQLARTLDEKALETALRRGDGAKLAALLKTVLGTAEGQRLKQRVEEVMGK